MRLRRFEHRCRNLIDEYSLAACPVILGSGRPLFRDQVEPFGLKLLDAPSFEHDAALCARGSHGRPSRP